MAPSLGSEPEMVGFDYVAPATEQAAAGATTFADSLGSGPVLAGFDEITHPIVGRPCTSRDEAVTIADSLGSEPMMAATPEDTTGASTRQPTRVAWACPGE